MSLATSDRGGHPEDAEPSAEARVVPSWTEPAVASASALIGGPLGRHALVGRSRYWTPLRVVLLFAVLVLAGGWLFRAPCVQQAPDENGNLALDWQANREYVAMCYSDVITFYSGEHLAGGGFPYKTHWNTGEDGETLAHAQYLDYPVLSGLFMWETAQLTRHYEALTAQWRWLPTGLPEVVFFDIAAALLAVCWLVVVWAVVRARRWRPWDGVLVALSPLALLHVFTGLDALAVAGATGGLYAFARRRPVLAGVLLGLAASAKLYAALLLIPPLLLSAASRHSQHTESTFLAHRAADFVGSGTGRLTGAAVLSWLAVNLPIAVMFTPGWQAFFGQGIRQAPGPDSVYYVLGYFTGWPRFTPEQTTGPIPWRINLLVLALVLVAVLGLALLVRLAPVAPRLASLSFLLVASVLLVNKSWSPQFSLWLVPLAVLALPRWRLLMTWMAADAIVWVPRMYYYLGVDHKGLPADPFLGTVLVRDALVVLVMVLVVRSILRPETDPVRALSPDTAADPDWPERPPAPAPAAR